jgi:hypothetical protein
MYFVLNNWRRRFSLTQLTVSRLGQS